MSSSRTRLFDDVVTEIQNIASPVVKRVGKDLFGFEQLTGDAFPAVFVVAGSGGTVEHQPAHRVREEFPFFLIGYVKSDTGTPDGVSDKREDLLQAVLNAVLGEEMQRRLSTAIQNNGSGAILVRNAGAPDTDEGQAPPFGYFSVPMVAILHYQRGAL